MHIHSVGTATPPARYTKADCLRGFENSEWFGRLGPRARLIARTVMERDNGIEARRLALDSIEEVFAIDPDTLSRRFRKHAPAIAAQAARNALERAGLGPTAIDAVVVSTCTGYLCPGLSGYVVEQLGLRGDVQAFDLVGQGCAAALPNLLLGRALLMAGAQRVLSVCVEISSAAMYLDDDPGVIISACLFGDGAGAAVLAREPPAASKGRDSTRCLTWIDAESSTEPAKREALMFEQRGGMLRNILTREVPALAAVHARRVLDIVLARGGLRPRDVSAWIVHAGGRDVLLAIGRQFELQGEDLRYSAAMLREYGNLSSAFVYFVLQAALQDGARDGLWWLTSFGAGFSCHGALLRAERT